MLRRDGIRKSTQLADPARTVARARGAPRAQDVSGATSARNGVKVRGKRILVGVRKRVDPGTPLTIAKNAYTIQYDPNELGAYGTPPQEEVVDDFFSESLLSRAGLKKDDKKK